MEQYLSFIGNTRLFKGINNIELKSILQCLNAKVEKFKKGDILLLEGETITSVGLVLKGKVQVVKEDYLGNRNIVSQVTAGHLFAESFSCVKNEKLNITVMAATDCEVIWMEYMKLITTCSYACKFHGKLIENMIFIIAKKNILMNRKIEHLTKRTTREKLLSYLFEQSREFNSNKFTIPFNRQELADYLCVDRSAMSKELSRLQKEGIIEFNKNHFTLHTPSEIMV